MSKPVSRLIIVAPDAPGGDQLQRLQSQADQTILLTCTSDLPERTQDGSLLTIQVLPASLPQVLAQLSRADVVVLQDDALRQRCTNALKQHGTVLSLSDALSAALAPAASRASAPTRSGISVVIPCYNHGAFVEDTVESVVHQTHAVRETIIVDDGSTQPQTREALERLAGRSGVRVLTQDNAGLAAARNAGIADSSGAFFVPLDADDRLEATFVARLLPLLEADSTLGYAYSHVRFFDAEQGGWACHPYQPERLLVQNLSVATALVRRQAFDEVHGYRPAMEHGYEDWDFWLALLTHGYRGRLVPEPLFHYRKHAGGSMLGETERHRESMIRQMLVHQRDLYQHALLPQAPGAEIDTLYEAWCAEEALLQIRDSRLWRLLGRFSSGDRGNDPRTRLQRLQRSLTYRTIQGFKRINLYRWYAEHLYGKT